MALLELFLALLLLQVNIIRAEDFLSARAAACRGNRCQSALKNVTPASYAASLCSGVLGKAPVTVHTSTTVKKGTATSVTTVKVTAFSTRTRTRTVKKTDTETRTFTSPDKDTTTITSKITSTPTTTKTLPRVTDTKTITSTTQKDATETSKTTDVRPETTTSTEISIVTETLTRTATETTTEDLNQTVSETKVLTETSTERETATKTETVDSTVTNDVTSTETASITTTKTSNVFVTTTTTITTTSTIEPFKRKRQAPGSDSYPSATSSIRSVCRDVAIPLTSACSCYSFTETTTITSPTATVTQTTTVSTTRNPVTTEFSTATSTRTVSTTTTDTVSSTLTTTETDNQTETVTESPTITETKTEFVPSTRLTTITETILSTHTETTTTTTTMTTTATKTNTGTQTVTNTITTTSTTTKTTTLPSTLSTTVSETRTNTIQATNTLSETVTETATKTVSSTYTLTENTVTTVAVSPTSLVQNSGFEAGTWNPWILNYQFAMTYNADAQSPYKDTYAGLISSGASGQSSSYIELRHPSFRVIPNQQYSVSMAVRMMTGQCYLQVTSSNLGILIQYAPGSTVWTFKVGTYTVLDTKFIPQTAFDTLKLYIQCEATYYGPAAYIDEIIVLPVSTKLYTIDTPVTGANVVRQSNFDSGTFGPWTASAYLSSSPPTIESPSYNGATYGAKFPSGTGGTLKQTQLSVQGGKVYGLRFNYKVEGPTSYVMNAIVYNRDSDAPFYYLQPSTSVSGQGWQQYFGVAPLRGNLAAINIYMNLGGSGTLGVFHISNVTMYPLS